MNGMSLNLVGPFIRNFPFGTEIAFSKGLQQLGFVKGVDLFEVDPDHDHGLTGLNEDATATIVFKSCVGQERELQRLRGPVIVYQPDDARFPHIRELMMRMRGYADLFLSFDEYGARVARSMGYRAAEQLLLTADPDLYSPSIRLIERERDIDVSFIGNMGNIQAHSSRRQMCSLVQEEARRRGWKTNFESGCMDIPHVVDVYQRSKVVLNHATDLGQPFGWGYGIQCRHFEVAMTRTALLSNAIYADGTELCATPWPSFSCEEGLITTVGRLVEGDWWMAAINLYSWVSHNMPIHRAGQIVNFVQRHVIG